MTCVRSVTLLIGLLGLGLTASVGFAQKRSTAPAAQGRPPAPPAPVSARAVSVRPSAPKAAAPIAPSQDHNAVIRKYCVTCHSETRKTGGLSLAAFDVARAAQNADVA